jgi:hypothetical protein
MLADGNPNPEVAVFNLTPRSGKAEVAIPRDLFADILRLRRCASSA